MRWTALLLLVAATTGHAAPTDLSWMSGDWRRCLDGEIVEERWLGPRADMMIGANLTTSKSGKASWELLRLVRSEEGWTFWASPNGQAPTPFRMTDSDGAPRRAVFVRAGNEFPTRVVYWREGDELLARIEGVRRGNPASIEWRFARGTADECPKTP